MVFWEPLICNAAVSCFNRTGKVPRFQLAQGDLIDLTAQITGRAPESIRSDIAETVGFVTMRCIVRCDALGTPIVVDEWRKT